MSLHLTGSLAAQRFLMTPLNAFDLMALLPASVGLYGVISYLVGKRTHGLCVRLGLGAQRQEVLRLILNHEMKMASGGVARGLIAALGLTRLLAKSWTARPIQRRSPSSRCCSRWWHCWPAPGRRGGQQ